MRVEHDLIIRYTTVKSLVPINSLQSVGNLTFVANRMLTDIADLRNLDEIRGDLKVLRGGMLRHISGLPNVEKISGSFRVENNLMLRSVTGLDALTTIGGDFIVRNSFELRSITGLTELKSVEGMLDFYLNPLLKDTSGLRKLKRVNGTLRLRGNGALTTLGGLGENLASLGGLILERNWNLTSLSSSTVGPSAVNGEEETSRRNGRRLFQTPSMLIKVDGPVIILGNRALKSLDGLMSALEVIDGDLEVSDNPELTSLDALERLEEVGGNLTLEEKPELAGFDGLHSLRKVGGTLAVAGSSRINSSISGDLRNLTWVGSNMMLENVDLSSVDLFRRLLAIEGNLIIKDSRIHRELGSKTQEEKHSAGDAFWRDLRRVNGTVFIVNNSIEAPNIVEHIQAIGKGLVIRSNVVLEMQSGLEIFPSLQYLCGQNGNDPCGLHMINNTWSGALMGFPNLNTFKGSLSIKENKGLSNITGFRKISSLTCSELSVRLSDEEIMTHDTCGGLTIAFNPNLRSVQGLGSLERVEGNLIISGNKLLDKILLQNLTNVKGFTRIYDNSQNLIDITSSEALPYFEPGCRTRRNTIPLLRPMAEQDIAFVTKLQYNKCNIEKLIPVLVGIAMNVIILVVSYLLFRYVFFSRVFILHRQLHITKQDVRNMFGIHILALAGVVSDMGFVVSVFILWKYQGPEEEGVKLLVIAILSGIVLAGYQLSMTILIYMGLWHKLVDLKDMHKRDWFLLFPGLLFLEAEVIKYLPWDISRSGNEETTSTSSSDDIILVSGSNKAEGFPHKYFARVAYVFLLIEDLLQIVLQSTFLFVDESKDGWAITAVIASLSFSIINFIVKSAFPFLSRTYTSRGAPVEVGTFPCPTCLSVSDK